MKKILYSLILSTLAALPASALERDCAFELKVNAPAGIELGGTPFSLYASAISAYYPQSSTRLDASGCASLNLYGGEHVLSLSVAGMKPVERRFTADSSSPVSLTVDLTEDIDTPYGLSYALDHDIFSGENTVTVSWNGEETVFADSFEDYDAFAISFAPWTGIDGDGVAAAALQGSYPNRGVLNYAQIINPMAVDPVWDPVQYPTLTARTGMQYAGFVQTSNGGANDDWLITPMMRIGRDNVLRFSVKSADAGRARFTVGITEIANPTAADFTIISEGNFIEADYRSWVDVEIPLKEYEGRDVKIGFHCMSATGAFISQLDDVFVGRPAENAAGAAARRVGGQHKAAGPYESYVVRLDGVEVARTKAMSCVLGNVAPGEHLVEITSEGLEAVSEVASLPFTINADDYVPVDFRLSTNNGEALASVHMTLIGEGIAIGIAIENGQLQIPSLPKGNYEIALSEAGYKTHKKQFEVTAACAVDILLEEQIIMPFNVTHKATPSAAGGTDVILSWNRNYGFEDSFEDYADFATGSFGPWTTLNLNPDGQPSYPIGLGSMTNIVNFPGCSTSRQPASVPPMVFNPQSTEPSMAGDPGVQAPTGVKTVMFQGPQGAAADKWLISPELEIRQDYELSIAAKAYSIYPETLELCISTGGISPSDFALLDAVGPPAGEWTKYVVSLADYVGQTVRIGLHCTSYDGFMLQVDDFSVGREGGEESTAAGYVRMYEVSLDGAAAVTTADTEISFSGLADGKHTVSVTAVYSSGNSAPRVYEFETGAAGADAVDAAPELTAVAADGGILLSGKGVAELYSPSGVCVARAEVDGSARVALAPGIYLLRSADGVRKLVVR